MNRNIAIKAAMAAVLAVAFCSATLKDKVMTKEKGTYVINTTTLGKDIMGYNGATPLKVYVKKNKVVKVEALPNQETPKYWRAASSHLLEKWNGMTVDEAAEEQGAAAEAVEEQAAAEAATEQA